MARTLPLNHAVLDMNQADRNGGFESGRSQCLHQYFLHEQPDAKARGLNAKFLEALGGIKCSALGVANDMQITCAILLGGQDAKDVPTKLSRSWKSPSRRVRGESPMTGSTFP